MTHLLAQDAKSIMKDGIETIVVPITHQHDLERLALEASRGGYAVVEWLLSYLGRWADLDRVCGLNCSIEKGRATINLELKQPGRQIEEWLRDHGECGRFNRLPNGDVIFSDSTGIHELPTMVLCARSLSREKFQDKIKPWWMVEGG